jgi:hypothetical protein
MRLPSRVPTQCTSLQECPQQVLFLQGTYTELLDADGEFASLVTRHVHTSTNVTRANSADDDISQNEAHEVLTPVPQTRKLKYVFG